MAYTSDATAAEVDALLEAEREHLLTVLRDEPAWATPSLCDGWSVRDVVSHLLMPYEMSKATFVRRMLRHKGSFDKVADDWVARDRRSPTELATALRRTATVPFNVPGSPVEAPLSHLLIHSEDVYRPLGVRRRVEPRSAVLVLDQLTSPEVRGAMVRGLLDGIFVRASDVDWTGGTPGGQLVEGPAVSLLSVLCGRVAPRQDLDGPGLPLLQERFLARRGASATA